MNLTTCTGIGRMENYVTLGDCIVSGVLHVLPNAKCGQIFPCVWLRISSFMDPLIIHRTICYLVVNNSRPSGQWVICISGCSIFLFCFQGHFECTPLQWSCPSLDFCSPVFLCHITVTAVVSWDIFVHCRLRFIKPRGIFIQSHWECIVSIHVCPFDPPTKIHAHISYMSCTYYSWFIPTDLFILSSPLHHDCTSPSAVYYRYHLYFKFMNPFILAFQLLTLYLTFNCVVMWAKISKLSQRKWLGLCTLHSIEWALCYNL